jgi:hypothetical protein
MERLNRSLTYALRVMAQLLPPERRDWAEAVQAEAGQLPGGWPRLDWIAGGLWLVVKEARVMRKFVYWAGIGGVVAIGAWALWRSWTNVPATDVEGATDRVRLLVGAVALIALPWVGRRHGWFGPVGNSIAARLTRLAGCLAIWGIGLGVVRLDKKGIQLGATSNGFNSLREIGGLVMLAALVVVPLIIRARRPSVEASTLWSLTGLAAVIVWTALPLQVLTIAYIAGILLATSRRSAIADAALIGGMITGVAAGLIVYGLGTMNQPEELGILWLAYMPIITLLIAVPAGAISAWHLDGVEGQGALREARIRQGLLAGAVAGACCGLLVTNLAMMLFLALILGPPAGLVGGALGGAFADQHPLKRRDGSRAAGLFVSSS